MFEFLKSGLLTKIIESGLKNCSCKFYEMSIISENLVFNYWNMVEINVEAFKKAWFTFEEIESIKQWIDDVENGNTVSFEKVKKEARKKIFSNSKVYA